MLYISYRVAAGPNSPRGPAGRGHYHKDRERLEETQHTRALPGLNTLSTRALFKMIFDMDDSCQLQIQLIELL